MSVVLVVGLAVMWFGHAIWLSRVMNARGFHPLPWIMVSLLIGPVVWPLALIEALSGLPAPEMLRRGKRGGGALDIFVLFEDDHVPDWIEAELQRLMPSCRRLVLARVIKAGGPTAIEAGAARFLKGIVSPPGAKDAELQLHFGDACRVITGIEAQGDSASSPLGAAILGRGKGDKVRVDSPTGSVTYLIVDFERTSEESLVLATPPKQSHVGSMTPLPSEVFLG